MKVSVNDKLSCKNCKNGCKKGPIIKSKTCNECFDIFNNTLIPYAKFELKEKK